MHISVHEVGDKFSFLHVPLGKEPLPRTRDGGGAHVHVSPLVGVSNPWVWAQEVVSYLLPPPDGVGVLHLQKKINEV